MYLLELIKLTTFKLKDKNYLPLSIHNAKSGYYGFNQGKFLNDYKRNFMKVVEVATSYRNQLHDEAVSKQVCQEKYRQEDSISLTIVHKKAFDLVAHNKYI